MTGGLTQREPYDCTQPLREGKAVQLLAEIFDHVVALGFAMHQHVQPQRFLAADGAGDFGAHRAA
jgi:hypothetical protein